MLKEIKEFLENFSPLDPRVLRDLALGLLGGVARLAYDHRNYDGIGLQFWYSLFRTTFIVGVMVTFARSAIDTFCLSGAPAVALLSGGCFFAYEVLYVCKRSIGTILAAFVKKIL